MLVTLRVLVAALGLATKALAQEATCYAPNGDIADNSTYSACNQLGITQAGVFSTCCALNAAAEERELCSSSGLCITQQQKQIRGFCTDKTWESNACVRFCMDEESGGSSSKLSFLTPCNDGTATYCCGDSNTACCGTEDAVELIPQPAAAGGPDGPSSGTIAGVVVGCLGGLALIGAAFTFWSRRRHRNKTKGADDPDEPGMGGQARARRDFGAPKPQLEPVELPAESFAEPRADPPPSEVDSTPEGGVNRKSSQVVQGK
ncbi:hypothetical protein CPLU01_13738 [Colletotrichum plurivorum]|uniref:Uncharacterized protein n=1 Tax=Colletotrichum plurivorum TaxID=2175906 RepID=A0A8H6N2B9_9PEZI|nr:hypothetical protein CPLU01_13738 [Colletotrichum plurivorum]